MRSIQSSQSPAGTLLALFLLFLLTCPGCNRRPSGEEGESESAARPLVPVKTAQVYQGDVPAAIAVTGKTEALKKEKVFAPVSGWIVELKALEGTSVHKGDLMAVVRPKETQAAIAGAEALLKRARTPAQEDEARKALALAESSENTVDIRASFDGIVSSRAVTEGELVGDNAELFTLVDLATLVFMADVPLAALDQVRTGQSAQVTFTGLPGRSFRGQVEALSPQSDPQSQTVRARIRFAGAVPSILRTEMAGTARIIFSVHSHALLLPRSALLRNDENNTYSVVTVTPDSIAISVPVTVGVQTDSVAEITGGALKPGTPVVTEGNYALADSTKVALGAQPEP